MSIDWMPKPAELDALWELNYTDDEYNIRVALTGARAAIRQAENTFTSLGNGYIAVDMSAWQQLRKELGLEEESK